MIPQRNISRLSNRLAEDGGRRIPEAVLERDYCLAWFLAGLANSTLRPRLIFKGGTALKRCYFGDYRFSEDLDFTLADETSRGEILEGLEEVYETVLHQSGIRFQYLRPDRRSHQNSHTFYLGYDGPLPATSPKAVKVDVTIREVLVCPVQERPVLRGYDEFSDLPEGRVVCAYALDEIAVEKLVALTDRARNEPRDLYDLWYLTSERHVDLALVQPELDRKLKFRGRDRGGFGESLRRKEEILRRLWEGRLAAQMTQLAPFEDVYRAVTRVARVAGIIDDA